MDATVTMPAGSEHDPTCFNIPELRRLKYFYGQLLSAEDFRTEQDFFREKLKLHNRCLHGYGVVCGLLVEPVPLPKDCTAAEEAEERALWEELEQLLVQKAAAPPAAAAAPEGVPQSPQQPPERPLDLDAQIETLRRKLSEFYRQHCREEPRTQIRIGCGLALDCAGNELVVRRPLLIDLAAKLSAADLERVKHQPKNIYVSLCYCAQPVDPARPALSDACGVTPECVYGKWRDTVLVQVTVDPPKPDKRCETCCEPCPEECLLLAEIADFCPGHPLRDHQIRNYVRRPIGLYLPTKITGVSWRTGHHYSQEQAKDLMGTRERHEHRGRGLEIRFSRRVLASTIRPGVLDTWVIEGGRGSRGRIYHKDGEFVDKPHEGTVDRIFYRDTTDETLEPGDRLLVILRTDFILDECCRAVDGENIGGRVPTIHEYAERHGLRPEHDHHHEGPCSVPPAGYLPWTSGNGTPGGTFVSWFFIREDERERR
jgi:hypothetical protein